jgi:D-sedoheptulose 7-phosphate isomerase
MSAAGPRITATHLERLGAALREFEPNAGRLERWGHRAAQVLLGGGRLLACGNGGSAEQAQHLTAELVGRYQYDRPALAALPLHQDVAALTAISNDYGAEQVFARQVQAHGRPGDLLVCLSTSGSSLNVIAAAEAAAAIGMTTWALTGPAPNLLAGVCSEAITVTDATVCTIQEVHLAAIHIFCEAADLAVMERGRSATAPGPAR